MPLEALEGFTVGITADRRWEQQADLLRRRGAEVLHGPTLSTRYLEEAAALHRAIQEVTDGVDITVVTTGVGVRTWFEAAESLGAGPVLRSRVAASRILCRGPKAAAALKVAGVGAAPVREAESLGELLGTGVLSTVGGARIAFQHHGAPDRSWVERLESAGATVIGVPVYRWSGPVSDRAAVRLIRVACEGSLDAVTFTSAPALANLFEIAARHDMSGRLLGAFNDGGVVAACVGPVCADSARRQGIERPAAPEVGRLGLLVRTVTEELAGRRLEWSFDGRPAVLQGRALAVDGEQLRLAEAEKNIVAALAQRPGAVVAKAALARRVRSTPRAVEAAVGRLRARLGTCGDLVQTVPSRGYRLRCP